jgi:ABC-type branched-subunit amino acid transport system substrate-binding protein
VALVSQYSGPIGVYGNDSAKAWELAAEQVNADGGVDGHKVEIVKVETNGDPAQTLRNARNVVTRQKVKFLSGITTSGENASVGPQLVGMGALNIITVSKDDSLTGKTCSPNMFRTTTSAGMDFKAVPALLSDLPVKKWAIMSLDILTGHTGAEEFAKAAKENGQEVVSTQFSPLGTTEFGSFITKIDRSGADGLFVLQSGADAVAFVTQGKQFKLFDKMKSVVTHSMLAEPLFPALGDTIKDWYAPLSYITAVDNAKNTEFKAAWEKKYGADSKLWFVPGDAYLGAQFLFEAVRKAKSIDPEKVKVAMNGLTMDTIAGPYTMRAEDHQALRATYVGQVTQDGDALGWKIGTTVTPDATSPQPNPECKM